MDPDHDESSSGNEEGDMNAPEKLDWFVSLQAEGGASRVLNVPEGWLNKMMNKGGKEDKFNHVWSAYVLKCADTQLVFINAQLVRDSLKESTGVLSFMKENSRSDTDSSR